MADAAPAGRGGFRGGFGGERRGDRGDRGDRRGGRGGDRGGRGGRGGRKDGDDAPWVPCTKLGRLVKDGKIRSIEEIYLHSLPIKEYQIADTLTGGKLKDEVVKIKPVQKQTRAGQRTRFKAYVIVGDAEHHVGLGGKCAKEVANAIRGAIIDAKLNIFPVRKGYWGNKIGEPHTVASKLTGKAGSVTVRLIPAPRGTGIVAAGTPKKVLQFAGVTDCYSASCGNRKTQGNFVKATIAALKVGYQYLTPELWVGTVFTKTPAHEFSDYLARAKSGKRVVDASGEDRDNRRDNRERRH